MSKQELELSIADKDRIIEMAWEDRTTFEAIEFQFSLSEKEVINLMRRELKRSSWKMWHKRVQNRTTKQKRNFQVGRYKCSRQ